MTRPQRPNVVLSQRCFPRRAPAKRGMAPPRRGPRNLPGFGLLPWGWDGWMRGDLSPPSISISLEGLLCFFVPQSNPFSIPLCGAHQPSASHPHTLMSLSTFLRPSGCQTALPTCRTPGTRATNGTGRWDAWLAAARFLLSEHYPSLMS